MRWSKKVPSVDELVAEHYASLYRYAYRLSGEPQLAEDLTQETFCQAQAKLAQLREPDKARSWLFTILRNAYLHRLRHTKKETALSLDDVGEIPDRAPTPLPVIDPQRLQDALTELPEPYRTSVILFYFEEFSYRDIAEHMEVPIGTVMSRLSRAKAFLKGKLWPAVVEVAGKEDG